MDIKEVNVELEKYIDIRVEEGVREEFRIATTYKLSDKKAIVRELEKAKARIEEEHKKALKLWQEALDVYFKYMSEHRGGRMVKDPPKKPEIASSYDKIDGYISMFNVMTEEKTIFSIEFLEKVFLEVARGIEDAKKSTAYMAYCASGCSYAMSDYTLSVGDLKKASWSD
jgi:hypothetical protein